LIGLSLRNCERAVAILDTGGSSLLSTRKVYFQKQQ